MHIQPAATADREQRSIDYAMKTTHDMVIAMAGPARLSAVEWAIYDSDNPSTFEMLDQLHIEMGGGPEPALDGLRQFMAEHPAGALILATCEFDAQMSKAGLS